ALIVPAAWLFSRRRTPAARRRGFGHLGVLPGGVYAALLYGAAASLLILQPDIGQTILLTAAWSTVFFIAGIPILLAGVLGAGSIGALIAGYFHVPHVKARIDAFLNPGANDTHQVDKAMDAFRNGGLFGMGPGEGQIKHQIPDAHTDFVFAVAAEEYGILLCLIIVALFAFLVARCLARALGTPDRFVQLAVAGLAVLIGLQAAINMGVTIQLLPAKGMTLPLISSGGSSLLATALTCGMILALTRGRASPRHLGL
ncbi:MAG: FtsW/RodA/SpoVE family cell cycle protein, partial [Alphaproteobacteria bacterium]